MRVFDFGRGLPIDQAQESEPLHEQHYRQLKAEPGLDQFDGRSYLERYHHVTIISTAYALLTLEMLPTENNLAVSLAAEAADPPADAPLVVEWYASCRSRWAGFRYTHT